MVYGYYPFNPADPKLPKKMMEASTMGRLLCMGFWFHCLHTCSRIPCAPNVLQRAEAGAALDGRVMHAVAAALTVAPMRCRWCRARSRARPAFRPRQSARTSSRVRTGLRGVQHSSSSPVGWHQAVRLDSLRVRAASFLPARRPPPGTHRCNVATARTLQPQQSHLPATHPPTFLPTHWLPQACSTPTPRSAWAWMTSSSTPGSSRTCRPAPWA